MNRIQNNLRSCKISLSCFDDKRYILDDEINSLAYFHKDMLKIYLVHIIIFMYILD